MDELQGLARRYAARFGLLYGTVFGAVIELVRWTREGHRRVRRELRRLREDLARLKGQLGQAGKVALQALTPGTGLSGGAYDGAEAGTWSVAYGTTAGTAAQGNDSRLSDARTPTAHASTHGSGGGDPLTLAAAQITSGTFAFARLPTINPGIVFGYSSVNVGQGRYPTVVAVQAGAGSGTTAVSSAYHLYLPANTTWRLEMITSYSYGGGGQLRGSVRTASVWGGTYAEAVFVTTTNGGIGAVFSDTLTVGASPVVAVFECYHPSSGINNVLLRFFQVG